MERMVLASSNIGDQVLDPFCGSGTTLRVCQQLKRNCVGPEINLQYVNITNSRLAQEFKGFDSIDPKMMRIPLDLNDKKLKQEYLNNHKQWFLTNHQQELLQFELNYLKD